MKSKKLEILIIILVFVIIALIGVIIGKELAKGGGIIENKEIDSTSQENTEKASERLYGYTLLQWEDMVRRFEIDHFDYVADEIKAANEDGDLVVRTYKKGDDGKLSEDLVFSYDKDTGYVYDQNKKGYILPKNDYLIDSTEHIDYNFPEGKDVAIMLIPDNDRSYVEEKYNKERENYDSYFYIHTSILVEDYEGPRQSFFIVTRNNDISVTPKFGYYDKDNKFVSVLSENKGYREAFTIEVSMYPDNHKLFLDIDRGGKIDEVPVIYRNGKFDFSGYDYMVAME